MASPIVLGPFAIDFFRAGPSFRRTENDHRPQRSLLGTRPSRLGLDAVNVFNNSIERCRHRLVHLLGIAALDKIWRIPVAPEELIKLLMTDAGQDAGIGDLVAVEVQDREHDAISEWIQKLIRVP